MEKQSNNNPGNSSPPTLNDIILVVKKKNSMVFDITNTCEIAKTQMPASTVIFNKHDNIYFSPYIPIDKLSFYSSLRNLSMHAHGIIIALNPTRNDGDDL